MGCESSMGKKNKAMSHNKTPIIDIKTHFNYDLNIQYYVASQDSLKMNNYIFLEYKNQQISQKISSSYKIMLFIQNNNNDQRYTAQDINKHFESTIKKIDWSLSSQVLCMILQNTFIKKNRVISSQYDIKMDTNKQKVVKIDETLKLGIFIINNTIFVINIDKFRVILINKDTIVKQVGSQLSDNSSKQKYTMSCFSTSKKKLTKSDSQPQTKILYQQKNEIQYLFFGTSALFQHMNSQYLWQNYNQILKKQFPQNREQIGWKYTNGQIQTKYKQILKQVSSRIIQNNPFIQDQQFQIGVMIMGGF